MTINHFKLTQEMVCLAILSGEKNLRIKQQNEYKPI